MTRRLAILVLLPLLASCSLQTRAALERPGSPTATVVVRAPSLDVVAFCGPSTSNPHWRQQLAALADIGVTAVHGYCYTPPADYTVTAPGARYASQAKQLLLAGEAQRLGIGVVAYDPTFWTDPAAALAAWAPFLADGTLAGIDLGDEPGWADMAELRRRSDIVRQHTPLEPQVIFLNGRVQNIAEQHHALPTVCPTSNDYERNQAALDDTAELRTLAGCAGIAIDTTGRDLDGDGDRWSLNQLATAIDAGYRVTLFTGTRPENFPTWDPLVDDRGRITPAGRAVQEVLDR
jgi:hypothetical protein